MAHLEKFKKSGRVSLYSRKERNYIEESRIGITPMRILIALVVKLNVTSTIEEMVSQITTILWIDELQ